MNEAFQKTINRAIADHQKMVEKIDIEQIEAISKIAEKIIDSVDKGGCVYICGNGGSAADAQHIAGELVGRFLRERRGLPAVALSTDSSVMTSIANDYSYDNIFYRQVEALVGEGDVFWAISTSGNSSNVVSAAKLAAKKRAKVVAFTGKENCKLDDIAEVCFCAPAEKSYLVQQVHQIAYHIICELVEQAFAEK